MAKGSLGVANMSAFNVPQIDTMAPAAMSVAPDEPKSRRPASESGLSEVARLRQRPNAHRLNRHVHQHDHAETREKRKRQMLRRVAHFARRDGRALESHVEKNEQQRRLREGTVSRGRRERITRRIDKEQADGRQNKQRDQLPDGEDVRDGRCDSDADDIGNGES